MTLSELRAALAEMGKRVEALERQMREANCIACNGFISGSGWCDRHREMLQQPNPILESMPMKKAGSPTHTYQPRTKMP